MRMSGRDRRPTRREFAAAATSAVVACRLALGAEKEPGMGTLRAGACAVDISPRKLPVIVSGSFLTRMASKVNDPLHARCLVLDDGTERIAICVVDTLFVPRDIADAVKAEAAKATGIRPDRMLISATHSHSCPSVAGCLGTDTDEGYRKFLPPLLVEAIEGAAKSLAPAKVGWATIDAPDHTHCRRWIFRPDKLRTDPFGQRNVRAHMHPGYQNADCIGPSGPPDPQLSLLAVQAADGRPVAVLANYSMHYYGAGPVSADYYGVFCRKLTELLGADKTQPPFVAIMSHGTSGDLHWMDYGKPSNPPGLQRYAEGLAQIAVEACKKIEHRDTVPIRMAEKKLTLARRVPDEGRLAWAKAVLAKMGGNKPRNLPEVYAREALYLHEEPKRELILQAIRVGDPSAGSGQALGITAIPCEVYGLTGLKLKAQSPLQPTMNIELANGGEGYIPPPELHPLGGYNTWPARTAALEVQAETKIVETVLGLLEDVAGKPRRKPVTPDGPYARAVLASKPLAYWRMGEAGGSQAIDASGNGNHGTFEEGVVFYLDGPPSPAFCGEGTVNRAAHFAGGRMKAHVKKLGATYTVEMWCWNGMPANVRAVAGYLFSRGADGAQGAPGDHLGIGGKAGAAGRLLFYNGDALKETLEGATEVPFKAWAHVVLVRDGKKVAVYLDGNPTAEILSEAEPGCPPDTTQLFIGGRNDGLFSFEGKIDEVAVYDRALPPQEIARHHAAAEQRART